MLPIARREITPRDVLAERENPSLTYYPERLQESSSTHWGEKQPIMNISRSDSSPFVGVSEDISNHSSTEAIPAGSLQGIKVTPAISEDKPVVIPSLGFKERSKDSPRGAIFFSSARPSELRGYYRKGYQKALTALQTKDPTLAEQVISWGRAYHVWSYVPREQRLRAYQELQQIENSLPLEAHALTAFYRAGEIMDHFHSYQAKHLGGLTKKAYPLLKASKINNILAQATSNIKALLDVVQICQQESEKIEIKEVPFVVNKYKTVLGMAVQSIHDYAFLIATIKTNDGQAIQSFLEKREQRQAVILAKPALCASLLNYHQRMEDCKQRLSPLAINNEEVENALQVIDSYFNRAIQATSCHGQTLFEKAGDYRIQAMEEEASSNGNAQKAESLKVAALVVIEAGKVFEEAGNATTVQGKAAYDKALDYYVQRAEEIAANGFTQKAQNLESAASAARNAGKSFKEAAKATSSEAKMALEKEAEAHLQIVKDLEEKKQWQESFQHYRRRYGIGI